MLAGSTKIKNEMSSQAVSVLSRGTSNPTAAAISTTPVKYTISCLKGTKEGIINAIPSVKAKCPTAVKKSITDIAILPAKAKRN